MYLLGYFSQIEESIARDSVFCAGSVGYGGLASYRNEDMISRVRNPVHRNAAMVCKKTYLACYIEPRF